MSAQLRPGDRVQMTGTMPGDPDPLPVGATGTVVRLLDSGRQADVDWDVDPTTGRPRNLLLLVDVDPYEVIARLSEPTCQDYGPEPGATHKDEDN